MTALRQLSGIYVAVAGAYAVAMAFSAHPDWSRTAEHAARTVRQQAVASASAFDAHVLRPGMATAESAGRTLEDRIASALRSTPSVPAAHDRIAQAPKHHPVAVALPSPPVRFAARLAAPPALTQAVPQPDLRETAPPDVTPPRQMTLAPDAAPPESPPPAAVASLPPPPSAGEIIRVQERLKASLTREMIDNFELFLYVSKADSGPWAQRMYVFQKQPSGDLTLLYNWPVSTGREQIEFNPAGHRLKTVTPPGYYELDPHRSYEHYVSGEWHQPMPYAMFFNWVKDGNETGLAIHAASGDDVAKLGSRASAGCIHLSEDNAHTLFTMIRSQYRGLAPRFAIDRRTGTMSNQGILVHDAVGNVKMAEGYKVLVFIEDYGGENVVAALF